MGNLLCMGLPFRFIFAPSPLDVTNNGLPTFVNVNVFDGHFLLALATVTVEGFHLGSKSAGEFIESPFCAILLVDGFSKV